MPMARMSDAAVRAKTGRDWKQWFSILDKAGAMKMSHKEIAEYLYEKQGVPGWWSQMVAVTYEQERGLRDQHERPDGYSVSASKTLEVPISVLYKSWSDEKIRSKWLKEKIAVRKATANKSMRITWHDGTHVDVYFYNKGAAKSQVAVQHGKLADSKQVELARSRWKAALDRLSGAL
jgi:hypothetical protein